MLLPWHEFSDILKYSVHHDDTKLIVMISPRDKTALEADLQGELDAARDYFVLTVQDALMRDERFGCNLQIDKDRGINPKGHSMAFFMRKNPLYSISDANNVLREVVKQALKNVKLQVDLYFKCGLPEQGDVIAANGKLSPSFSIVVERGGTGDFFSADRWRGEEDKRLAVFEAVLAAASPEQAQRLTQDVDTAHMLRNIRVPAASIIDQITTCGRKRPGCVRREE